MGPGGFDIPLLAFFRAAAEKDDKAVAVLAEVDAVAGAEIDHAGEGIRVNAVCPGPIFTRFHERRATTAGKEFEEFKAEFGRNTMLKRPGTPREVAACILFLASDEASYVTGTCLFVDGGQTAM